MIEISIKQIINVTCDNNILTMSEVNHNDIITFYFKNDYNEDSIKISGLVVKQYMIKERLFPFNEVTDLSVLIGDFIIITNCKITIISKFVIQELIGNVDL